ncbi:MAG: hypothetical protein ACXVCO_15630 [Ktedonobacterales bacterium]
MAQYSFATLAPEYRALWAKMKVTKPEAAKAQAKRVLLGKSRYKEVERTTGVPWFVVGVLHLRESDANFQTWLHNGDRMRNANGQPVRTHNVPTGRPPNPRCTWEEGAYDALVTCEHFDQIKDWNPARVAYVSEKFNGFGYRNPSIDIPSPYLWGGTSVQKRGKYVADRQYNANVMDPQVGTMAVLKALMELDKEARFKPGSKPDYQDGPHQPPTTPRADDTEDNVKPLRKSKTIWGGLVLALTSIGSTFASMFEYVTTPLGFAAFCIILVLLCVGTYLVIKGRIDVQKLIKHLSEDPTPETP